GGRPFTSLLRLALFRSLLSTRRHHEFLYRYTRLSGLLSGGALPRRFREHPEHRENQRFSLQIIGFGVARGADDLFPYLSQPCKAGQIRVGVVGAQLFSDPAIDAVDESRQRHPVAG